MDLIAYMHVQEVEAPGWVNSFIMKCPIIVQWNLSKTTTCGPVITDLHREVAAIRRSRLLCFSAINWSQGGWLL